MTSRIDIIGQNGNDALAYQRGINPTTSSMTNRQKRQVALDIGRCSDGRPCGEVHEFCQDAYCADCPNDPDQSEQHLDMVDPLADLTVSVKPTAHADNVNHPAHYQSEMGIECIMAIRAQMTCDQFAAYCQGNIIKYLWRWREKGGVESLKKAKWYLYRMIAEIEDE